MSVFKKIDPADVSITPFNVHKDYTITSYNYSGSSCGYGVGIMSATHRSWSFADALKGKPLDVEEKNPNGTYKSIMHDSINHLYYSRVNKPSENFGGNRPEKEVRDLQERAHVVSIPSPLYDLRIKSGSLTFTDEYIESLAIHRERKLTDDGTTYTLPVLLGNHWKVEASQSKFVDHEDTYDLSDARDASPSQVEVVTGSIGTNISRVGTGSLHFKVGSTTTVNGQVFNVGNGLMLRQRGYFVGTQNPNWWSHPDADNAKHGMPAYTVTMWVKPPNPASMNSAGVTGAPGQSTLITRDKNSYFELNILTGSLIDTTHNPKGLVPLQMFWGATGSNCTTSASRDAASTGFGLATGSWNLVSLTQEFWPGIFMGTSGSQSEELPPWGHSPAKTTLRIYRPDPKAPTGYTNIKQVGLATASLGPASHWSGLTSRAVTSSIQYSRNMYIGASGSVPVGADDNDPNSNTLRDAFTGSIDDIRFYESALNDAQVANLLTHPEMDLRRTPPATASFNLVDDGFGNIIDRVIPSSSFADNKNKLVGYYGFNELYTIKNQVSKSGDYVQHDGYGKTFVKDYSTYKNNALSDKVKFVPGIALMAQSGSVRSIDSVNFYQTNVRTGICAQFNNSGSIRIPHHSKLNLGSEDGFAISFWIKIPENQVPGINTITHTTLYATTGQGHSAGGTSTPCANVHTGSAAGRDYVTIITKSGLGKKILRNSATGEHFGVSVQGPEMENAYPYHIELKNTHYEKDGKPFDPQAGDPSKICNKVNTIVIRRLSKDKKLILESKTALTPLIDNHVVIMKNINNELSIWINGKLDVRTGDNMSCTSNGSDVFLGDKGTAWVTGSNKHTPVVSNFIKPKNPFSGSIDELRFYDTGLSDNEILTLYENSLNLPTAYQTNNVGNVIYEHGIVTLTNTHIPKYFSGSLHTGTAEVGNNGQGIFSKKFRLNFKNTRELYEQKIKCHAKATDFNLTTNPTARKSIKECTEIMSVQELADFAKTADFNPYLTTVGLYDDFGRLLAIAKLARPIQKLKNVDMTFVVKFDR